MFCIPSIFLEGKTPEPLPFCTIICYTNQQPVERAPVLLETHAISLVLEGEKRIESARSRSSVGKSDYVLMKAGRCLMTERSIGGQAYSSVLLFFNQAFPDGFHAQAPP